MILSFRPIEKPICAECGEEAKHNFIKKTWNKKQRIPYCTKHLLIRLKKEKFLK